MHITGGQYPVWKVTNTIAQAQVESESNPHGLQPAGRLQPRIHYDMASTSSAEVKALLQELGAQAHLHNLSWRFERERERCVCVCVYSINIGDSKQENIGV